VRSQLDDVHPKHDFEVDEWDLSQAEPCSAPRLQLYSGFSFPKPLPRWELCCPFSKPCFTLHSWLASSVFDFTQTQTQDQPSGFSEFLASLLKIPLLSEVLSESQL
jgi:hypothetical protein